jgi:hypothetical protein
MHVQVDFDKVWSEIEPSVVVLVKGSHQPFSYEKWQDVYRGVYNICTNPGAPQAEALFFQLRDILVKRVSEIVTVKETLKIIPLYVSLMKCVHASDIRS